MALTVGDRLGHYDVTALIGEGGMGQVYQATDTKLNRQVALKILPQAFTDDPDRLARFEREARVLASLNHPNIGGIRGLEESDGIKASPGRPLSLLEVPVRSILALAVVFLSGCAASPNVEPTAAVQPRARSVILFIGDGLDDHQLSIGRNYLAGGYGAFSFDEFSSRAAATVSTVQENDPTIPVYVGDSGSGGTAMSAGVVTSLARIATRAKTGEAVPTILELAEAAGKQTGVVTTASLTDATPATFAAHISRRFCQGPEDMSDPAGRPGCPDALKANGGLGSIAEQLADSDVEVLLGGGYARFAQRDEQGMSVLDRSEAAGYEIVRDAASLERVDPGGKILGLFGDDTLPVAWIGEGGARAEQLQLTADGKPIEPDSFVCVDNPEFGDRPTLEAMTTRALDLLKPSTEGFFLMVESASIDKQAHAANPCGEIGEIRALGRAVRAAVNYQEQHPDTLIIVASDHGQTGQIVPWPSLFVSLGRAGGPPQYPPGKVALIRTPARGTMAVSYGTNVSFAEEHTGTQIPVFAQGPGADGVRGLIQQSDLFRIMMDAMGL